MKSIWLVVIVVSIVLAKADKNAFRYNFILSALGTIQSNGKSLDRDSRSEEINIDQLMDDQHLSKLTVQNHSAYIEQELKSVATKIDHLTENLADHMGTVVTKLNQLIDGTVGESGCPENATDGVYKLKPDHSSIPNFPVYCENGWIVIHRRFNGSLDFNRTWNPYREGFGDLQGEHWLGLEKMHQITRVGSYELKVVLKGFDDEQVESAKYVGFKIGSENELYRLNVEKFVEGDAGDSLMYHNMMKFSTPDRNNDQRDSDMVLSCAVDYKSGWWFNGCYFTNLNGIYEKGNDKAMSWYHFFDTHDCLKEARMMIRAVKTNE